MVVVAIVTVFGESLNIQFRFAEICCKTQADLKLGFICLTLPPSTGIYRYTSLYSICLHFTFCSNSSCTKKLVKLVSRAFLQELPIPYCGMFFITKKATSIYPC